MALQLLWSVLKNKLNGRHHLWLGAAALSEQQTVQILERPESWNPE